MTEAYSKAYDDLLKPRGESEALDRIGELCEPWLLERLEEREEGRPRQPADLGQPHNVRSLLGLIERAEGASQPGGALERLISAMTLQGGQGCSVELAGAKGFRRCLIKAQEDYGGDFLSINDVARCTVVVPKLSVLAECLRWLVKEAHAWAKDDIELPSFEPLMAKDRLSPSFDAEGTGMYRYVLLVGRMKCDGINAYLNVEVQFHVKRLFELKKKLGMLYEGRTLLGADEDEVQLHEGALTEVALERVSKGMVRRVICPNGREPIDVATRGALVAVLQATPCMLLQLDLSGTTGFEGFNLGEGGLLLPPGGDSLSCFRLRTLKLARMSLAGEIPKELSRCTWLQTLELQDNWLRGKVPEELKRCSQLCTLALHGNSLCGELPATQLAKLTSLATLTLGGELGGNAELFVSAAGVAALEAALPEAEMYLPRTVADDKMAEAAAAAEAALNRAPKQQIKAVAGRSESGTSSSAPTSHTMPAAVSLPPVSTADDATASSALSQAAMATHGWTMHHSPNGMPYYHHRASGQTSNGSTSASHPSPPSHYAWASPTRQPLYPSLLTLSPFAFVAAWEKPPELLAAEQQAKEKKTAYKKTVGRKSKSVLSRWSASGNGNEEAEEAYTHQNNAEDEDLYQYLEEEDSQPKGRNSVLAQAKAMEVR